MRNFRFGGFSGASVPPPVLWPLNSKTAGKMPAPLLLAEFLLQAKLKFGTDLGNLHAGTYQEFATEHLMRLVIVHEFAGDAAILAILIPTEPAVGDRFRADVLKTAENCIFFRDLEGLPENLDFHQTLIGTKYLSRSV